MTVPCDSTVLLELLGHLVDHADQEAAVGAELRQRIGVAAALGMVRVVDEAVADSGHGVAVRGDDRVEIVGCDADALGTPRPGARSRGQRRVIPARLLSKPYGVRHTAICRNRDLVPFASTYSVLVSSLTWGFTVSQVLSSRCWRRAYRAHDPDHHRVDDPEPPDRD